MIQLRSLNKLPVCFIGLFIATYFVNKYVLSVLKFTYPTIFQGWQTLVGALMLKILHSTSKVNLNLTEADRYSYLGSLPASLFFVCAIYSGSRALANIPIPYFFAMHNVIAFFNSLGDFFINKELVHPIRYFMVLIILISAFFVGHMDPQYDFDVYMWMVIHVLAMGFYNVYSNTYGPHLIGLGGVEKLYICYILSVIVLGPSSYLLGDTFRAREFPFFKFYKFYIGCVLSGVCGCLLNVCAIFMRDAGPSGTRMNVEYYAAIAKVLCSVCSIAAFDVNLNLYCLFWMCVNMLANLAVTDPRLYEYNSPSTTIELKLDKDKQNGCKSNGSSNGKDNKFRLHEV